MILAANIWTEGAAFFVGAGAGYWLFRWRERSLKEALALKEQAVLDGARREAETIGREARLAANEEAFKLRAETDRLVAERRREIESLESRARERESVAKRQADDLGQAERKVEERERKANEAIAEAEKARAELGQARAEQKEKLAGLARMTEQEARTQFLRQVEEDASHDGASLARNILEEARSKAEEKARRIISLALQRYAGAHTFETSTATVALSGDDIKGRIIGREGRNIRAFEAATGVTVLIDDTPNAVVLSGFDPVRREIAREAMERLILDGRIHPTRIEEVVLKVTEEIDEAILRSGEEAVRKVGLPPMHADILKLLGRLRFRHSFSQNVLDHSVEVAHLMGLMAAELGIDITAAKRAGLLHDIGKAVNHEVEGAHAMIGADILKRHGESEDVVNGVASHHDEVPHTGLLGILVSAADAMSASRPGARSETMSIYIKRVEDLERIGGSFPGVEKCYAVQAGRELRVIVQPDKLGDDQAFNLARDVARKIEDELQYPGQIRVTVVRETRCVEFAK
jgi:ribonuclease Y